MDLSRQSEARAALWSGRRVAAIDDRALAFVACAVASVVLALCFGRDLNWDFFNYHLYAGLMLAKGRLTQDFMAAGYQGYMNPLPYLPLYAMTAARWHSVAVATVLAGVQSLNFALLYLVCRRTAGDEARPALVAALLTALGACSGPILGQLGSSFIDLSVASPVMAGVVLLMPAMSTRRLLAAGALAGAAVGLKLTNAVFFAGLMAAVAVVPRFEWRLAASRLTLLALGGGIGFLAAYGFWGWQLHQVFGSFFFPMFNEVFKAPDFPAVNIQYQRFVPQSLGQLLTLPLRMMELSSWQYVETEAPDLRPAVLVALALAAMASAAARRISTKAVTPVPAAGYRRTRGSELRFLGAFWLASFALWVPTSSNGRYAAPLLLLMAPLIYWLAKRLVSSRRAVMGCMVLLVLQAAHLASAGNPHWAPDRWAAEWLPAEVPDILRNEPQLFLTIGQSSESYIAAFVHPDSVFANPIGMISVASDSAGWKRLQALMARYHGRTQVVFFAGPSDMAPEKRVEYLNQRNAMIDRIGLGIDGARCETMVFNRPGTSGLPFGASSQAGPRNILSCPAHRIASPDPRLARDRSEAERIMNLIEDRCPGIFSPARAQVEGTGNIWVRMYGKYDIFLAVDFRSTEVFFRMEHETGEMVIGHTDSIDRDVAGMTCALPRGGRRGA